MARVSSVIAAVLCLLVPFAAQAVTVSVVDLTSTAPLDQLSMGDEISFGVVLEHDQSEVIWGIEIYVQGFDRSIVRGTKMEVAEYIFSQGAAIFPGGDGLQNYGGIPNSAHPDVNPYHNPELTAVERQVFGPIRAITLSPTDGSGEHDIGVDGGLISEGDVHARLTFEVTGSGMTQFLIGANPTGDPYDGGANPSAVVFTGGRIEGTNIVQIDLVSMPEPSTALLIGMGLAALSRRLRD